jgi:hypothetical protein
MTQRNKIHYGAAALSFFIPFIVYLVTMQPTVAFWDCGEFAAAAWRLQVPHPPGSPLWSLIGRIAMMVPFMTDIVARYNFVSVVFGAATISLLYLIAVRLIAFWREPGESLGDILSICGSAFIGAMALTFSDSFWYNALESEVYAFTMFLIASVVWLVLRWGDENVKHHERYLLLVSYIIGLGLGTHQMIVLTVFTLALLIYFRQVEKVTVMSLAKAGAITLGAFVFLYKFVLTQLVGWLAVFPILPIFIILAVIVGIWRTQQLKKPIANMAMWSVMLVLIGYSTYTLIIVRSNQGVPMNQNAPSTFAAFQKYLQRDQYGDRGFFPRRSLDEFGQKTGPTWDARKYSSDGDFFVKYQIDHMSNRYLYWNFIGRAHDKQDSPSDWSKTWGIPFLLGFVGLFWHFKRDPKRATAFLMMFLALGIIAALFQNTQDPSMRERDYFYVGSYFVFAIWIGMGCLAVIELLHQKHVRESKSEAELSMRLTPVLRVLVIALIAVPLNPCLGIGGLSVGQDFSRASKWAEYSRAGNYVAFDCAYNILQSCDKDAILFTYGDNDTYPLWCLQDVYGIRQDVRIVLLSMANAAWYIKQLKNDQPWGAKPIVLQDPQFANEKLDEILASEDPLALKAKVEYARDVSIPLTAATMRAATDDPTRTEGALTWKYLGSYDSKDQFVYTTADQLSMDIIRSNINTRPIYYSVSVPTNFRLGLDQHLASEGLALRVTPDQFPIDNSGYGGGLNMARAMAFLLSPVKEPATTPRRGALIRTFNDASANIAYIDKNFSFNYLMAYMRSADQLIWKGELKTAKLVLDTMSQRLPPDLANSEVYPTDMIADLYQRVGDLTTAQRYAAIATTALQIDPVTGEKLTDMQSKYRLANLRAVMGKFDDAEQMYKDLQYSTSDISIVTQMKLKLAEVSARKLDQLGKYAEALEKYEQVLTGRGYPQTDLTPDFKSALFRRDQLRAMLTPKLPKADLSAK